MSNRFPFTTDKLQPLNAARDWPLLAAAASALLAFVMLFPPWLTSAGMSLNAFGENMLAAGPALIIVMAVAMALLAYGALATRRAVYLSALLIPASNLLVLYIVQVADVCDLAEIGSASGVSDVSTGPGVWLGFVFSLAAALCAVVAFARRSTPRDAATAPGEPPHIPPDEEGP